MIQADTKRRICERFKGWTVRWRKYDPGRSLQTGNDAFLFYVAELEGKRSQLPWLSGAGRQVANRACLAETSQARITGLRPVSP